ncbi:MAG: thioredoxin family protein [Phycisphaeraceae bacterium]
MADDKHETNAPTNPRRHGPLRHAQWVMLVILVGVIVLQWPIYRSIGMGLLNIDPPDDGIGWRTDFAAAQVEAAETGKPLLVNFTADWCGPCVAMKRDVWPRDSVGELIAAGYVPVRLDIDLIEGKSVGAEYDVRAIPTTIVMDAEGQEIERANYLSRRGMEEFLQRLSG